jgi:predicted Zn-dependent peptidase
MSMTQSPPAEYKKTVLPNGLRVLTEHIPSVRSIAVGIWVESGSRYEDQALNGISHFVEHMVFKGTARRTCFDIAHSLESVGGMLNAFTGKETTCYYARILDEHLPQAVDVLADIMQHSLFDPADIEKEKKVILEEINTMEDTPDDWIHELYDENLLAGHPLSRPILGRRETVGRLAQADLRAYIAGQYSGERIVVAAAGNVEHEQLVALAQQHLRFPSGHGTVWSAGITPRPQTRLRMLKKDILQTHLCLGCVGLPFNHPDRYNLLLLNTILGSGMSSRLFQNIREKTGMAYSVYSYLDCNLDTGLFSTYIATDPDKTRQAIELIVKEYQDLMARPVPAEELEKCKSQLKGNLLLGLESTSNRMTHLAKSEIYEKRFVTLDEIIDLINRVTAKDIRRVANDLLTPGRLSATILSPLAEGAVDESVLEYRK